MGSVNNDANKENVPDLGNPSPLASETLKHAADLPLLGRSLFQHTVEQAPSDSLAQRSATLTSEKRSLSPEEHQRLESLVGKEALQQETPETLLLGAAKKGDTEAVGLLIKLGADINTVNKTGNTPLHEAAEAGKTDVIMLLAKQPNVDLNKTNRLLQTPLHKAAAKGQVEAVKYMLTLDSMDASLNAQDKLRGASPLLLAAGAGHKDVVDCFIEAHNAGKGIDLNAADKNGETALILAINKDHDEICIALIQSGKTDPNHANANGYTALHRSVSQGNPRITTALLTGPIPADVNQANLGGSTPLHIAAAAGNLAMVELLINEGGADINAVDLAEDTPLHGAAESGHANIINTLIHKGSAEINAVNKAGNTPLHLAAASGKIEATKALLEAKDIQANIVNTDGISPLAFAEINARTEVCALIRVASDPKREELIHETKLMGHRFNLSNLDPKSMPDYQLEGYGHYYTNKELATHWDTIIEAPFSEGFWKDNQAALKEHFTPLNEAWRDTRTFDGNTTAQAIAAGKPCSIPGSFPKHYISMSISGDVLCINNRGFQSQEGGGVDQETIGLRFINIKDHKDQFSEGFVNRLHRGDVGALREIYRMPVLYEYNRTPQKRGNCTLTQGKADRQAHLIYFTAEAKGIDLTQASPEAWKSAIAEVEPLYHDFALYDRAQGLAHYSTLETDEPYHETLLKEGQKEMVRLAAKQNGHYNVINNGGTILA